MTSIKGTASAVAILIGLCAPPARAGYVVDLTQQGDNVVATGSGALDLTGLGFIGPGVFPETGLGAAQAIILTGPAVAGVPVDAYLASFTGPANFGTGLFVAAGSGNGDWVGIDLTGVLSDGHSELLVPRGYLSGSPLSDTATYFSHNFSILGVTPGTYEWTWGSGANQNFTLVIGGGSTVPEPSTWVMLLLGFAGLGIMGYRSAGWRRATAYRA